MKLTRSKSNVTPASKPARLPADFLGRDWPGEKLQTPNSKLQGIAKLRGPALWLDDSLKLEA